MIEAIGVYMIIAGIAYALGWLTSGAMVRFASYLASRRNAGVDTLIDSSPVSFGADSSVVIQEIGLDPFCLVCGDLAQTLGDNPHKMIHVIKIKSCTTQFGHVRQISVCVTCADDIRDYLNGPTTFGII